jgi:hypothetical protein
MITAPDEECLNRRRGKGGLLVGIENTVRETSTTLSYRKFTDEQWVDEFGPVGVNLGARAR